tara:strand:+ start:566 stop:961 length:396 start_codon:yes stop_codon:yes gene_type:complete
MTDDTTSNIVQFPKKYVGESPKIINFDAMKLNKELNYADELTDGIMVSMIHNLDENDIEIHSKDFIKDIAFLAEIVKSTIYRDRGFQHPFQNLVDLIASADYNEKEKKHEIDMDMELVKEIAGDSSPEEDK